MCILEFKVLSIIIILFNFTLIIYFFMNFRQKNYLYQFLDALYMQILKKKHALRHVYVFFCVSFLRIHALQTQAQMYF